MRSGLQLVLVLHAVALAAVSAAATLAIGLPLASHAALRGGTVALLAGGVAAAVLLSALALLVRGVGRPLARLFAAAGTLGGAAGAAEDLPLIGERALATPARAALAFERLAQALGEERARLAAKMAELTSANAALADARASLVRSEKLATVGRLAAGLAHEVGNPLGAVEGYLALARTRLPPDPHPDLLDALDRIGAAAGRIDRTVRDLLDFARPSAPVLGAVALPAAVDAALRLARVQARFRGVEVTTELPPDLPRASADEHQLIQVLLNVLLNAADAMSGGGRIRITAREEPGAIALAVADTGPGIPEADLSRIFDPFFTTKDPGHGTGLGLAISHRLMECFGGEIVAHSDAGGAVFTLRLRRAAG